MKLFIDTEFDGPKLLSIAVVPLNPIYAPFYEVADNTAGQPWVQENVLPLLFRSPIGEQAVREKLHVYLQQFPEAWHFIADWPEDIARICELLMHAPKDGTMVDSPPEIEFTVWRVDADSSCRHNALADAQGLASHYQRFHAPYAPPEKDR